jgi:uncharacterized damage-inducible protein DinB
MSAELIREHYDYHRWANRRLFDVAHSLGTEATGRDLGKHWSFPTLKGMFSHIYGADNVWLTRWKGSRVFCSGLTAAPNKPSLRPIRT